MTDGDAVTGDVSADGAPADGGHYDGDYYAGNGQDGDRPALRWYVRLVSRYCGPGPHLDFGCGTGHLLRRLSALGAAAGFEISSWSAAAARGTAGCPVYETLDELPEGGFSVVVAVHVLEHLDDATAAQSLAAWRRALRPGGRALVVMPDPAGKGRALSGPGWVGYDDPTHINLKPHAGWRSFFDDHGFTVLREGSDGLWNVPYGPRPRPSDALRAAPAFVQWAAGRLWLPPGSGESSVFVLQRRP